MAALTITMPFRGRTKAATAAVMSPARLAFPAMAAGSALLAFGPWLVRLADVGEVSSAFWRVALAAPVLILLAGATRTARWPRGWATLGLAALGAAAFGLDLAAWHLGITRTTLANAALLSNAASFLLPLWGFALARTWPNRTAAAALLLAALGTALLMGGGAEFSERRLVGDLFCLVAALLYTAYLIVVDRLRGDVAPLPLLATTSSFAALVLLPLALAAPGAFWPADWTPLLLLALGSQVLGQGLVVFAVGHLKPLVVGLTLLMQPVVAAAIGAWRFGEVPGPAEFAGAALVVTALVLVRLPDRWRGRPAAA